MGKLLDQTIRRICKRCGKEYHPTSSRQMYCNQEITINCEVCGKPFTAICKSHLPRTCSAECNKILSNKSRSNSVSDITRICKWCGKPFTPVTMRDVYCRNPHYKTCVICGKQFLVDVRLNSEVNTCSLECKNKLSLSHRDIALETQHYKETIRDKYGVDNIMQVPGTKEKIIATVKDKYGTEWYTQTEEYKIKYQNTVQQKYGMNHHLSSPEVIAKRKQTCVEKYGVDNVSKSDEVKHKIKQSLKEAYGVENYSQYNMQNFDEWCKFVENPREYILSNFDESPTLEDIAYKLGVCLNSVYDYIDLIHNSDIIKRCKSRMESEVIHYLSSIDSNIVIQPHNRSLIYPYEVDIYLPDYKLAIECNPTATHNSSVSDPWGGEIKPADYHKMKSTMCNNIGIRMFHIFSYEWKHKQDIIKSMLKYMVGQCSNKIYARDCCIKDVDYNTSVKFLNDNHRQGGATSSIRLGLYHNDELVALMTFSALRSTISKTQNGANGYELVRFCNKLDTQVIGGASKLFKSFIHQYSPIHIVSYSDISHTSGKLYSVLGFNKISESDPGYVWVDTKTDRSYNRVNAQKANIKKFLNDPNIDLSMSENDIMMSHGYVKVYDSGTIRWEWSAK